jgi:tetratricopeptide (TPR) repeat protein
MVAYAGLRSVEALYIVVEPQIANSGRGMDYPARLCFPVTWYYLGEPSTESCPPSEIKLPARISAVSVMPKDATPAPTSAAQWEMVIPKMERPPSKSAALRLESHRPTAIAAAEPIRAAIDLRARGRLQEALDILSVPGEFSADFYALRGDLQLELGQIKEAAGSYFAAATSQPDHVDAMCKLGSCLRRLERFETAAEAFQTFLNLNPQRNEIHIDLGDCLLRLNRFEEALAVFDQCRSEDLRARSLFGQAVALQLLGRGEEAEANYERLLALDPQAAEALSNQIAMSIELFDLNRARLYSQRLLEINSRSTAALKALAVSAIERRDYPAAARYFFQAMEQEPEITRPAQDNGDEPVEYRISRKVFEKLTEAAWEPGPARARASHGGLP